MNEEKEKRRDGEGEEEGEKGRKGMEERKKAEAGKEEAEEGGERMEERKRKKQGRKQIEIHQMFLCNSVKVFSPQYTFLQYGYGHARVAGIY